MLRNIIGIIFNPNILVIFILFIFEKSFSARKTKIKKKWVYLGPLLNCTAFIYIYIYMYTYAGIRETKAKERGNEVAEYLSVMPLML